jgi:cardiolipin synthase (CMP-forming)
LLRHLPNFVTLLRLLAAPLAAWLLSGARYPEALVVVILAGLTDWLDGFTARKLNASGKTGIILDPLADKVLLVVLFVELVVVHLIPMWMLLLAVIRDLVIVVGAALLRWFRNIRRFTPSYLGKVSTFFQIMLVLMTLVEAAFPSDIFYVLRAAALALCAIFTVLSGLDYVRRGIEMARAPRVS